MSLREKILQANDLRTQAVTVPEWDNVTVHVRAMSGAERDSFDFACLDEGGKINVRAKLIVRTVTDDQGARIFSDEDAAELGRKSGRALDRLYGVAARLNGLTKRDVEELEKNSGAAQSGTSG